MQTLKTGAMELAVQAGQLLLESGAEIHRVQDTVTRIAHYYEVQDFQVFVISNGLFASSCENGISNQAVIRYIPLTSPHYGRLIAVNQLSREIAQGKYTVAQAFERLHEAAELPFKPIWQQVAAAAVSSAGFCYLFGGGAVDSACACCAGTVMYLFLIYAGKRGFSRISTHTIASAIVTLLGVLFYFLVPDGHLSRIIIGSIIPLLPGVAFTTAIRDYLNGDSLSGTIHLTDSLITAMCIAVGVGAVLLGTQTVLGVKLA